MNTVITQEDRDDALECYYDIYKGIHGIKPRWLSFDGMSKEEIQAEFDSLQKEAEFHYAEEERMEKEIVANFEKRIVDTIATGAKDRATALRWILQAEGLTQEYDMGYVCFCLHLPYKKGYEQEFLPLMDKETV